MPRKRTSALHYTRRRHASFVPGSCASGGVTGDVDTGIEEKEGKMRGRGRAEERVRCKWEAGAEGTAWINTITRGWLTTRSPWQRGWEATRDNHPLLVIEIIRCQHSTSFTMPTFSLPLSSRGSVLLTHFVFLSLNKFQIFGSQRICVSRCQIEKIRGQMHIDNKLCLHEKNFSLYFTVKFATNVIR